VSEIGFVWIDRAGRCGGAVVVSGKIGNCSKHFVKRLVCVWISQVRASEAIGAGWAVERVSEIVYERSDSSVE
jgi:hypothetical protein